VEAAVTAADTEAVVVVVGLSGLTVEREELDRADILLPGQQLALIANVTAALALPGGGSRIPVIVAVMGGGAVDLAGVVGDAGVGGLLWLGYPGQVGSAAVRESRTQAVSCKRFLNPAP
jgi:hypothetical protein